MSLSYFKTLLNPPVNPSTTTTTAIYSNVDPSTFLSTFLKNLVTNNVINTDFSTFFDYLSYNTDPNIKALMEITPLSSTYHESADYLKNIQNISLNIIQNADINDLSSIYNYLSGQQINALSPTQIFGLLFIPSSFSIVLPKLYNAYYTYVNYIKQTVSSFNNMSVPTYVPWLDGIDPNIIIKLFTYVPVGGYVDPNSLSNLTQDQQLSLLSHTPNCIFFKNGINPFLGYFANGNLPSSSDSLRNIIDALNLLPGLSLNQISSCISLFITTNVNITTLTKEDLYTAILYMSPTDINRLDPTLVSGLYSTSILPQPTVLTDIFRTTISTLLQKQSQLYQSNKSIQSLIRSSTAFWTDFNGNIYFGNSSNIIGVMNGVFFYGGYSQSTNMYTIYYRNFDGSTYKYCYTNYNNLVGRLIWTQVNKPPIQYNIQSQIPAPGAIVYYINNNITLTLTPTTIIYKNSATGITKSYIKGPMCCDFVTMQVIGKSPMTYFYNGYTYTPAFYLDNNNNLIAENGASLQNQITGNIFFQTDLSSGYIITDNSVMYNNDIINRNWVQVYSLDQVFLYIGKDMFLYTVNGQTKTKMNVPINQTMMGGFFVNICSIFGLFIDLQRNIYIYYNNQIQQIDTLQVAQELFIMVQTFVKPIYTLSYIIK